MHFLPLDEENQPSLVLAVQAFRSCGQDSPKQNRWEEVSGWEGMWLWGREAERWA
jgi:hypothetical protein